MLKVYAAYVFFSVLKELLLRIRNLLPRGKQVLVMVMS